MPVLCEDDLVFGAGGGRGRRDGHWFGADGSALKTQRVERAVARAEQQRARVAAEEETANRRRADAALAHRHELTRDAARAHLSSHR